MIYIDHENAAASKQQVASRFGNNQPNAPRYVKNPV
jgi:hypothetical protein